MLRPLSYLALAIAFSHVIFGAIVRISGSGMGCGDNWPKCYGAWFPPMDRPDLIIEVTHRYLAAALLVVLVALAIVAWRKRAQSGVGGRGGVLRATALAVVLWIAPAVLGAVTVMLGNATLATVAHKLLALALLAVLVVAVIRAGGLGAASMSPAVPSPRTARGAMAAAALTLVVVMLGALTAKIPGASAACQGFPLCSGSLFPRAGTQRVHMTHRVLAFLLALHVLGLVVAMTRRRDSLTLVRAGRVALAAVVVQILIAATMVLLHLPNHLRSLHQAVGVFIWLSVFSLAYLARRVTVPS